MTSIRNSRNLLFAFSLLLVAGTCLSVLHAQDWEDDFKTNSPGKRTFDSACAGCHGLDGRGSEKAPNITSSAKVQHLSEAQLANIVSNGIPGTGMPAFHSLNPTQVRALISYMRVLQGKADARALTGDPGRGKAIFFGKGECSTCHAISGQGGFMGPDLTSYGSTASADAIRNALVNSARTVQSGYKPAAVITRDGSRVEGIVRNEDNFSVQLQTTDGTFHFFQKADMQNVEYLTRSLMPADYGKRLSSSELNDLISYVMSAASPSKARQNSKRQ